MESMTGYSYCEKSTEQFSFSIELKSLNSRYLEVYTSLPDILRNDENKLTKLLKERLNRGKIELIINIFDWKKDRSVSINTPLLKKYYEELSKIETELGINNSFTIDTLIRLDNVILRDRVEISENSRFEIQNTLETTIIEMLHMRMKESNAIRKDLQRSLSIIYKHSKKIKNLSKNISKKLYQRLKNSIESLIKSNVDNVRLYTEVAILADKVDINEELIRLEDHLKKFKSIMNEDEQIGKRLDFLAQEMFREANTISAKSNNSEVSHLVVDIKNHIDKIREHCRNIV
ncbi:MAG: YicC/YloC family endoribonuclease [Spirochaetota bacterium]|nr:YicC/YloC family endoribonuclease [Spirochaetota bacterium]